MNRTGRYRDLRKNEKAFESNLVAILETIIE